MSRHRSPRSTTIVLAAVVALVLTAGTMPARADDPGVTATTIVLGGTHPYSGPASAYAAIGKGAIAYFGYVNDNGGVNGRKIEYKDLDDGYSPPQSMQLTRQLVDQDKIFAMFNQLGTPVNVATRPYLNQNSVPHLFLATGATLWGAESDKYPWTIGWQPDYQSESVVYARYLLRERRNAKIAVLYQNDDYGQDYLAGLKRGLGARADLIVRAVSYEVTDPDVTSQIGNLRASGADTFFIFATPKFAAQALIVAAQQSWRPEIFLNNVSAQQTVMDAAIKAGGAPAVSNVITTQYLKDPADNSWANDSGMQLYRRIMAKSLPQADAADSNYIYGMAAAYTMVDALKSAGRNLTRQGLMNAATHLREPNNPFLIPGVSVQTSPTDRFPIRQQRLAKYDVQAGHFVGFGTVISART
jgi:branched-chain amino acid transport system substrate-binding protein